MNEESSLRVNVTEGCKRSKFCRKSVSSVHIISLIESVVIRKKDYRRQDAEGVGEAGKRRIVYS